MFKIDLSLLRPGSRFEVRAGENFCPGVLHAVPTKDGFLIRIRVPGGLIQASQFTAVANVSSRFADRNIEITSRANLQIRALKPRDLQEVAREITAAGLLPSTTHDRVRNIVTSPLAGLEAEEIVDTRPMVRELDRRLQAESLFANLSPKFSFGLHGGMRRYSHDVEDVSLEACGHGSQMQLSIAGVSTKYCVSTENAVDCLLEAARFCIGLAQESGVAVRAKRISAITPLLDALRCFLIPCMTSQGAPAFVEVLPGVLPGSQSEFVNLVPSVPLGRLSSRQAGTIADIAERWGGDLRLTPWRGVLLGLIPIAAMEEVVDRLTSIGLRCDGRDGFQGVAACAGITGCDASLADVRRDATSLAQLLSGKDSLPGWTVNLSGCEKQCARRHGASAELIAGDAGYLLKINNQPVKTNCSPEFAIDTITALHARKISEVAAR